MHRRSLASLMIAGSLGVVLSAPVGAAANGALARPGFHAPVTLPGSDGGTEPSLAITTAGVRYPSWQGPGEFAVSPDGIGFTNLGSPDPDAIGDVTNAAAASGALYNGQICGDVPNILHSCVYRSLDGGHRWTKTELADMNPGASDRPWIDVYPKLGSPGDPDEDIVYLEYHTFTPDDLVYVTVSHDGGATFSPPTVPESDTNAVAGSGCNTIPSGITVDERTGAVYALWLSGNDVVSNGVTGCNYSQIGPFNKAWVSVSTDQGTTWTSHLAWQGAFDQATKIGDNADKIFGTIAVDRGGQVHVALPVRRSDDPVAFVADCETNPDCQEAPQPTDLLLATSPDHGEHWTAPYRLNRSAGSNFFPWITGGSRGRVDAVYYRSTTLAPNDPASVWSIGFAQVTGAVAVVDGSRTHYRKAPRVALTLLDQQPVHNGGICTFGIFCAAVPNANRDLADSIVIALDPAGGANAAWTNDASGTSRIDFACQDSGPSAYAGKPPLAGCYAATP
jgi:hypothetical protein